MFLKLAVFAACFYGVLCKISEGDDFNVGIIGGHKISIKNAPYMVSIQQNGTDGLSHQCGGTIIHRILVLSAAYCFRADESQYKVVVGDSNFNRGVVYDVQTIKKHEKYKVGEIISFNIALVKLTKPLTFGDTVNAIQLGNKVQFCKDANVTGWGETKDNSVMSAQLLQATVSVRPDNICNFKYLKLLPKDIICAGGDNTNNCGGDMGGPLTQNGMQVGIGSYVMNCDVTKPGLYTNVPELLPWIKRSAEELLK